MRRLLVLSCVAPVALLTATPAGADVFGPISLASQGLLGGGEPEQADYAHDSAISGNGRYVAFDGSVGGVTGVWRCDLDTGVIEQVAGGDAELPSINENGQYVSFTTNEGKALPAITNGGPDEHPEREAVNVYVRDMSKSPQGEGAFTVVSATNGSEKPLIYNEAGTSLGSAATGRSAISADGQEVAFVTTAESDLVLSPEEQRGEKPIEPHTPPLQMAVRYIDTKETKLVSRCYFKCATTAEPVPVREGWGAVVAGISGNGAPSFEPPPVYAQYGSPPPGASISADGSTVTWMGSNIAEQAPLLPQESLSTHYTEPLWRRIAPDSETPTERVTGGSDPTNPACIASGERALPANPSSSDPCQGPFATSDRITPLSGIWASGGPNHGDFVPRLSADGYTVAFISQAPLVSLGEHGNSTGQAADLYVANMRSGLTRAEALTRLTELANASPGSEEVTTNGPIFDFDISPDGSQVAFTTRRTQFPLGSPAYVSAPAAESGMDELFDADLRDSTLTRVTHGYAGGPSETAFVERLGSGEDPYKEGEGALSPSFSTGGDVLAFSSTASNLAWGDGNTPPDRNEARKSADGSDAFVVERAAFGSLPTPQYISPAASGPALAPAWSLGVTALSRPDGSVELYVGIPGAGKLRALARGAVLVRSTRARRAARHYRTSASRRGQDPATVATRTVAAGGAYPKSNGLFALTLKLAKPYASLASVRGGLSASVSLVFTARGRPTLRQSIDVSFRRTARASRRAGKGRSAAHGRGARRGSRR
jgi:WD40-like Beta Propeller Repeat